MRNLVSVEENLWFRSWEYVLENLCVIDFILCYILCIFEMVFVSIDIF